LRYKKNGESSNGILSDAVIGGACGFLCKAELSANALGLS
jgi:hypothetical protein